MKRIFSTIIALAIIFLIFLWGFSIGNFLLTMTLCRATLDLPRESLSDISITLYASLPVFIVIMAFIVRRLIIKKNSDYSEN